MAALRLLKTVKNAKLFQEGEDGPKLVMIENVRLSFPAIGHMKEEENDEGGKTKKYKGTPMLPKATHVEAKDLFVSVINELLTENKAKVPPENRCIKNGDDSEREEYQGHWVISTSENRRPAARDEKGRLILDPKEVQNGADMEAVLNQIDEKFYAGCFVNILIRPWYFNGTVKGKTKTFPKRICAGLSAIQFYKDGGRFSAGTIDDSGVWGNTSGDDDGTGSDDDNDPDGL